jgi:hypothetical protein
MNSEDKSPIYVSIFKRKGAEGLHTKLLIQKTQINMLIYYQG